MADFSPEKVQEFFAKINQSNAEAWSVQAAFFEDGRKRNVACFKDLADARMSSFKEMSEAKTFTQAFEANLAFEERVREDLSTLQEDSVKAWEDLQKKLQAIYSLNSGEEKPKRKAPARKKTARKKTARKKTG